MSLLKKIQNKSRSTRILILWITTFVFMFLVFFMWIYSFPAHISKEQEENQENENLNILSSLFKSIKDGFVSFKQGLETNIENIYGE
jgi:heme/copper-type cytochrome/quinol oxidase subunit 2